MSAGRRGRVATPLVLVSIAAILAGCGGGSVHSTPGDGPSNASSVPSEVVSDPNGVVARVGGHAITRAVFEHALRSAEKFEGVDLAAAPVPPDYTACLAHLEGPHPNPSPTNRAALKGECEKQYQALLKQALDPIISQQWVIGGAAELGFSASEAAVRAYVAQEDGKATQAKVLENLAKRDESFAEYTAASKNQLLEEDIRRHFQAKAEHPSQAQVARFYREHKNLFGSPPRRDLKIVRTAERSEALKAKREIAAGRSFASVVKSFAIEPAMFSKSSVLLDYSSGLYAEPALNKPIMSAKPHVLTGPISIFLGSYVFEVTKLIPAEYPPLSQVEGRIKQTLKIELYKEALAAFIKGWRTRWRAQTTCQTYYVVAKCAGGSPEPEDPYTLD